MMLIGLSVYDEKNTVCMSAQDCPPTHIMIADRRRAPILTDHPRIHSACGLHEVYPIELALGGYRLSPVVFFSSSRADGIHVKALRNVVCMVRLCYRRNLRRIVG